MSSILPAIAWFPLMLAAGMAASAGNASSTLPPGSSRNVQLAGRKHADYQVALDAGQSIELRLRQTDAAGLELTWTQAGSPAKLSLRTEAGRGAALGLWLTAESRGAWQIGVTAADGKADARYSIALGNSHATTAADRERSAAITALAQAEALRHASNAKEAAPSALALYRQSISQSQRAQDGCGLRLAYVALAGFHHDSGDSQGQQSAAQSALQQACVGDVAEQAVAQRLLGSAYNNQGDYLAAATATERSVALFRQTGDVDHLGGALGNLGLAYGELGETAKAIATAQEALQAAQAAGDAKLAMFVRNSMAFMHLARGELAAAVDAYQKTLEDVRTTPYPMVEAVAWVNLGFAYHQLGESEEAFRAYAKADSASSSIDCWLCLAESAADQGDDLLDDGKPGEAAAAYRRALAIAKEHTLPRQEAEALRGLGRCAMASQHWSEARALLQTALEKLHGTHGVVNEALGYAVLGDLENRENHFVAARADYDKALALARQGGDHTQQTVALASLARVAQQTGDMQAARDFIAQAIELIESERTRIDDPSLRTSYFSSRRSYYALYVDILMRLDRGNPQGGYAATALIVAERARARSLQDQLAERAITIDRSMDPSLLGAEGLAEDHLHQLAYRLDRLTPDEGAARAGLQREIEDASRVLDEARGRVRAANPRYAEIAHPAPLSLGEIQLRLLDRDASVLEYWLGDERSYLWVVTDDALTAYVLPSRGAIERAADGLREKLVVRATAESSIPMQQRAASDAAEAGAVRESARELEKQILPLAAAAQLRRDVVVVADGDLQRVPFAVLDASRADAGRDPPPAYSYLPSIGALRGLRALPRATGAPGAVAVLADPVFRADDGRLQGSAGVEPRQSDATLLRAATAAGLTALPRLPHTRDEAQAIAALATRGPSWIALDFAANRSAVLDATWSDYSIVHFATHALMNPGNPELSGIVLSLFDANGHAVDGFLRTDDIYNLRLRADLVVLSVCDSAIGKSLGAEGMFNLARAFFYAGARRVVASLWPVDDRASVEFMRAFYAALLGRGLRAQDALVEAQREMQRNPRWNAPYYWSGYVLQGDWR